MKQPNPMEEFDKKFGILIYAETATKMANNHIKQFINDNFTPNSQIEKAMNEVFDEKMEKLDYIPRSQAISKEEVALLRQLIAETDITKEQIYERLLKIAPLPKLT